MAEQVFEPDSTLWKPKPGATTSAREFSEARALVIAIHKDMLWNPWVIEDSAEELAAAEAVFSQWTRAEPDFRPKTTAEFNEWIKKQDEDFSVESTRRETERLARVRGFDQARATARLTLLEREAQLRHYSVERADLVSAHRFPAMPVDKRAAKIEELDTQIARLSVEITGLREQVGDPETVVDKYGYLPADRRESARIGFMLWREREVRRLREVVSDSRQRLATKGLEKAERTKLREKVNSERRELDKLLDIPPQTANDMCSECDLPLSWHGYTWTSSQPLGVGPCPAWPDWARRIQKARDMLATFAASQQTSAPEQPKPEPLAVIPSGLPIAEVLKRLAEIQNQYPEAEVRRGARNKWEIWPATKPR